MSGIEADEPAAAQSQAQVDSSSVTPIEAPKREPRQTFQAVYTGFDDDLDVEIVKKVPASESSHQFGHALISRPEWDDPKKALLQNLRVDVVNGEDASQGMEETDG